MMAQFSSYLALLAFTFTALAVQDWRAVSSRYEWAFPRDHWARREFKTEWWYLTGHLESLDRNRHFGYQFTFFRIGVVPNHLPLESEWASGHLIMGHAAVSDMDRKEHWFSEILYRENFYLGGFSSFPEPVIAWSLAPPGTDGQWTLKWNGQGFDFSAVDERQDLALNLSTQPLKPLVFQGPGGISPKSKDPGAASFYYSLTRLKTTGVITVGGETFSVSGESWMDKEFSSSLLSDDQVGWDWFSLQLRDGRDLMLFTLRGRQNQRDFSWATLISENGDPSYLGDQDWELTPVDWWRSPSGAQYPVRWNLSAARVGSFQIVPAFSDQENRSQLIQGLNYWEGAVDVIGSEGVVRGRGYVELTGYAEGGRLPL